jgi:hypothetical protein
VETALAIMVGQGLLGAFDTVYFHEYRCRLPTHGPRVAGELRLHALRDLVYGALFLTLPFAAWCGTLAVVLAGLLLLEVCVTIRDFNVEVVVREGIGGVADSERGLHLVMAVVYGVFLAHLAPHLSSWVSEPTGFRRQAGVPVPLQAVGVAFGVGVLASGVRDYLAAKGVGFFRRDLFAGVRRRGGREEHGAGSAAAVDPGRDTGPDR